MCQSDLGNLLVSGQSFSDFYVQGKAANLNNEPDLKSTGPFRRIIMRRRPSSRLPFSMTTLVASIRCDRMIVVPPRARGHVD